MTWMRIAISAFAAVFPLVAHPQGKESVVGTWRLVSVSSRTDSGGINTHAHGAHPTGLLTYTADGRMAVVIAEDGRLPPLRR